MKIDLMGKTIADIGSGDGTIAKTIARDLKCRRVDIFEPIIPEVKEFKPNALETHFHKSYFEMDFQ